MQIAFLTTEYVTDEWFDGGLASYLGRISTTLVEHGHQVEVFVTTHENRGELDYHGVLVHRVNMKSSRLGYIYRVLYFINKVASRVHFPYLLRTLDNIYTARLLSRALLHRMEQVYFDIIQASNYQGTAYFAANWCERPIVVRASSYAPYISRAYQISKSLDQRIANKFEIIAFKRCHWHYAPSRQIAEAYQLHEGIHVDVFEPPFHLANVVADTSIYDLLPEGKPYLFHFGKIGRLKGSGVLADALELLLDAHPDFLTVIAGRVMDTEGQRLIDLQKKYPENFVYLGLLKPEQLYPVIENARLVVLPSLVDNLPNTALEAMYFRRIVIGTQGASFEQLIDNGISGFLVNPGDITGLCKAILMAWNLSSEQMSGIGGRANERISQMHPDIVIPKLEQYFQSVLESWNRMHVVEK